MANDEKTEEHVSNEEILRFDGEEVGNVSFPLVSETSVQICLNGQPFVDAQCMPHELDVMAVGFMVSEGILRDRDELIEVCSAEGSPRVDVRAKIPEDRLEGIGDKMKVTSGCGRGITIDNVEEVMDCGRPFNMALMMSSDQVMELGYRFNHTPGLYRETRCVHSAALSDGVEIKYFSEDIGRHNAVDKVIGKAFLDDQNICEGILLCTGRFSFDMVAKAARVRIPLVISPAAATREAILLARRFHMTLCGRVRKSSMSVYSCDWRVTRKST